MADLTDIQAAQSVKLIGSDATGLETTPVASDSFGNLFVTIKDAAGNSISSVANGAKYYLGNAMIQNVIVSTNNSSTTNLTAGSTFTGTSDSTLGVGAIQVNFKSTQAVTIQVQQSTDNTNWDLIDSYTLAANTGDGRTFQATGAYVRVLVTNNGASTTTSLRLQTILAPTIEVLPRSLTNSGNLKVSLQESNVAISTSIAANVSGVNGAITVGTSAVEAKVGASALTGRVSLTVFHNSNGKLYWGYSNAVTTANGTQIFKNTTTSWDVGPNVHVWLISDTAAQDIRVTEAA